MTTERLPTTFLFSRAEGFYPIHDIPKAALADHIKLNPGTLKVEEYKSNGKHKVVWTLADGWLDSEYVALQIGRS